MSLTILFNPSFSKSGDILLQRQDMLRKLVGILGMSLPIILVLFLEIDKHFASVLPSISHYYYTRACGVFVITVSLLAIFLIVYKGEGIEDYYASSVAGIFALLLVLFPTDNLADLSGGKFKEVNVTNLNVSEFRCNFHYFSAAIFLLSLSFITLFLFTKSDLPPSKRPKTKIFRNRIFRVCGGIMLCAIGVIFLRLLELVPSEIYDQSCLTFWMEVLALEAFGFSWMVKGKTFFQDKEGEV